MITPKIIEEGKRKAKQSNVVRAKMSALLFSKRGYIITSAHNAVLYGSNDKRTIHAEIFLLSKMNNIKAVERYRNKDLNILVLRIKSDGNLAMAKPCSDCEEALRDTGLNVYFSDANGIIKQLRF